MKGTHKTRQLKIHKSHLSNIGKKDSTQGLEQLLEKINTMKSRSRQAISQCNVLISKRKRNSRVKHETVS